VFIKDWVEGAVAAYHDHCSREGGGCAGPKYSNHCTCAQAVEFAVRVLGDPADGTAREVLAMLNARSAERTKS
jgi:hypothetical protein